MRVNESINFLCFDIYSKRITFFYNNKEKISSYFGLTLTLIYIFTSIILFIYYFVRTIKRKELKVYDSTIYSEDTPFLNVNSSSIYLAFGIEDYLTSLRFIDETIYYPQILYIHKVKKDGEFYTEFKEELPYERCKEENFGEGYQNFFLAGELNTSYCLKQFNATLAGGFKYDRLSYIRIKIFPCVNTTENNFHCKPREVIDKYVSGAYLSLIIKDIGYNPFNYSYPILPTIQDLYTTIDKQFFRDFIVYFGLTQIQSDYGYFNEQLHHKNYLKYRRQSQTFYFRDKSDYENGKEICVIQIRLDDYIEVQNRSYSKIPELFSKVGGYMQLMSTIFSLLSLVVNRIGPEIKILNGIFNFNIKQNKMIMKNHSLKDLQIIHYLRKSKSNIPNFKIKNLNHLSRKSLNGIDKNDSSLLPITIINNNNKQNETVKNNENINNNNNKNVRTLLGFNKKRLRSNKNSHQFNSQCQISLDDKDNDTKVFKDSINFNFIHYYCLRKFSSKKKEISLFNKGSSIYRKRMDIINVFTLLLLIEKKLLSKYDKKEHFLKKLDYPISPK